MAQKKKSKSNAARKAAVRKAVPKKAAKAAKQGAKAGAKKGKPKGSKDSASKGRASSAARKTAKPAKKAAAAKQAPKATHGRHKPMRVVHAPKALKPQSAPKAAKPEQRKASPKPMKVVGAVGMAKVPAEPPKQVPPKPPTPKPVVRNERRPQKERVMMEFLVHSAPNVLFELISTPSGFSEWYCDDVNVRGDQFTFIWGGEQEATTLVGRKAPEVTRFHRNDDDDPASFFEFRIRIDDMTGEVALIVTDHAWPADVEATRNLWASQIANLVRVLGA
jgi:hypothetical protein